MREHGSFAAPGRLWRLAVLTAAGVAATTQADAAVDYFSGQSYYPAPYWQDRPVQRPKPRRRSILKKEVAVEKDAGAKPHGPLIIAISIEHQKLKIYDANGFFAESPVSTGMKGHPTPMGVFSVIQKHKFHHSNIYSGAPMPYMQRITWSGVAMHAGVLPGYPASHGCIRMPMAFAIKMWNWTKMGARVVVTPGELAPEAFSHPLLASFKVPPQPTTAAEPEANTQVGSRSDKPSPEAKIEAKIEDADNAVVLKPALGHHELATPTSDRAMPREQTRTADAGADVRPQPLMLSDAAAGNALERPENAPVGSGDAMKSADRQKPASQAEAAERKPDRPPAAMSEGDKPTAAARKSDPAATVAAVAQPEGTNPDKDQSRHSISGEPLKSSADPVDATKKSGVPTTAAIETPPAAKDAKKDESRPSAADKPTATKPEAPKRAGQITVFISRKDSKLYVRQNFSPLFEAPVTVAASDRPLGTHVFTVEVDKDNANALRWSVLSLPASVRHAERYDEDVHPARLRRAKVAVAAEPKPVPAPDSPAEALDRLTIGADMMARINEMLTSGGSIVVSDQGINQGETGEGTDFIVRLR